MGQAEQRRELQKNFGITKTAQDLAGAPGLEPGNGGIKISLIIQQFQGAFGKTAKTRSSNFNRLAAVSK
jgi:hypothetical protein